MKRLKVFLIAAAFFSCNDVSNGGEQTNSDSTAGYDNLTGDPAGGGIYSTDSTAHKNVEPTLQGGAEGTGNDVRNGKPGEKYNSDSSKRIMNPRPGGVDSVKKAANKN